MPKVLLIQCPLANVTYRDAGVVYPAWKLKSETTMRKVAVDSSLGMLKHPKEYFGPSELWLLLSTIL